jgi:hypothetical protein
MRRPGMAIQGRRVLPKNFHLDPEQIDRARKALAATTETETIVRALEFVISEASRNRATAKANRRFLKSGISIHDAFSSEGQPRHGLLR